MPFRPRYLWRVVLLVTVLVAACGPTANSSNPQPAANDEVAGELLVFAAASLTDAFDELGAAFVRDHPDVEVVFNYAGSQTLAGQINEHAPADVFASADGSHMDAMIAQGRVAGEPARFAANTLAIAVEPGNPHNIKELADLSDPDLLVVLPASQVPAGRHADDALATAGVAVTPVSRERHVRAALGRVEFGEADAAIVYTSDLTSSQDAEGVAIPTEQNVVASYPIAALADAANPAAAEAFIAAVRSDAGQQILTAHGFVLP